MFVNFCSNFVNLIQFNVQLTIKREDKNKNYSTIFLFSKKYGIIMMQKHDQWLILSWFERKNRFYCNLTKSKQWIFAFSQKISNFVALTRAIVEDKNDISIIFLCSFFWMIPNIFFLANLLNRFKNVCVRAHVKLIAKCSGNGILNLIWNIAVLHSDSNI